jgi:hypothetical protein
MDGGKTWRSRMAKKRASNETNGAPKKKTARDWAPRFLTELAQTANIAASCTAAQVARATFYRRRDSDPDFAAACAEAIDVAVDAYRDHHEVKHTGTVKVTVSAEDLSDDELAAIIAADRPRPGPMLANGTGRESVP